MIFTHRYKLGLILPRNCHNLTRIFTHRNDSCPDVDRVVFASQATTLSMVADTSIESYEFAANSFASDKNMSGCTDMELDDSSEQVIDVNWV